MGSSQSCWQALTILAHGHNLCGTTISWCPGKSLYGYAHWSSLPTMVPPRHYTLSRWHYGTGPPEVHFAWGHTEKHNWDPKVPSVASQQSATCQPIAKLWSIYRAHTTIIDIYSKTWLKCQCSRCLCQQCWQLVSYTLLWGPCASAEILVMDHVLNWVTTSAQMFKPGYE